MKYGEVWRDRRDEEIVMVLDGRIDEHGEYRILIVLGNIYGTDQGWDTHRDLRNPEWARIDDAE